jgi:hypothetical protein
MNRNNPKSRRAHGESSLKKMLEMIEPFLPKKPAPHPNQKREWRLAEGSYPREIKSVGKHREAL